MPFSRQDLRASVERAGDEHWTALVKHHEDPYPRPTPTPGDVCRAEAERLNQMPEFQGLNLLESRVRRVGEEVELVHVFQTPDGQGRRLTEPFRNYAPDPAPA